MHLIHTPEGPTSEEIVHIVRQALAVLNKADGVITKEDATDLTKAYNALCRISENQEKKG